MKENRKLSVWSVLNYADDVVATYYQVGSNGETYQFITQYPFDYSASIEDTLHRLIEAGASDDTIRYELGAVRDEELTDDEINTSISIDLGWSLPAAPERIIKLQDPKGELLAHGIDDSTGKGFSVRRFGPEKITWTILEEVPKDIDPEVWESDADKRHWTVGTKEEFANYLIG